MTKQIEAVYKHGVFRPLEKLDLEEGEVVRLIVIRRNEVLKYVGILEDVPDEDIKEALHEVEEGTYIH